MSRTLGVQSPLRITCEDPLLRVQFERPHLVVSWALLGGGFTQTREVRWLQVHNRELTPEVDPVSFAADQLTARGLQQDVTFLTSHPVARYIQTHAAHSDITCQCIATVGLSNGRRAGDPPSRTDVGTINTLSILDVPLTENAMLEALALAAEARAAACLAHPICSPISGSPVSGSGTDCIGIAAPLADNPQPYAGKHTAIGHLIGKTVYDAVEQGVLRWRDENPNGPVF